jgi:hypothetical protein
MPGRVVFVDKCTPNGKILAKTRYYLSRTFKKA